MSETEHYDAYMAERGFNKYWFSQNGLACYEYKRAPLHYHESEERVMQAARNHRASKAAEAPPQEAPKPKRKRGSW
jgi:hypothetical protein